jgi:methylmalonyl-CoA/ethylmalonyl-CoA epimerase
MGEPEQKGTFMPRVELKQIPQICVVVRDVQEAMELYWKTFGIGPWQVYTMAPPLMTEMTIREKPEPYSMRIALAQVGNIQWELIQPLTGQSIYKEFLEQSGEGVHHVLSVVDDYDKALAGFEAAGMQPLMGGTWRGATFMYVDARKQLGTIVEIFKTNPDFALPEPEATYPAGK